MKELIKVVSDNDDVKVVLIEDTEAMVNAYHLLTDAVRRQLSDFYLKKYGDDIDRATAIVLANSKVKEIQTARLGKRGGKRRE